MPITISTEDKSFMVDMSDADALNFGRLAKQIADESAGPKPSEEYLKEYQRRHEAATLQAK